MAGEFQAGSVVTKFKADVTDFSKGVSNAKKGIGDFAKGVATQAAIAGAAIAGVGAVATKFAVDAGRFEQIKESFQKMTDSTSYQADVFINKVKNSTSGLLTQQDVMQNSVRALALIGKDSFESVGGFQDNFVKMAGYAQKAAQAMGQDMGYMFDSLVTGVGRASPMILDNLGITVKQSEAYEMMAESLGKEVDELTTTEQKTAILNLTMQKLGDTYGNVETDTSNVAVTTDQLKVKFADMKLELGKRLAPVMGDIIEKISTFTSGVYQLIDGIVFFIQEGDIANDMLYNAMESLGLTEEQTIALALSVKAGYEKLKEFYLILKDKVIPYLVDLYTKVSTALTPFLQNLWDIVVKLWQSFSKVVDVFKDFGQKYPKTVEAFKFLAKAIGAIVAIGFGAMLKATMDTIEKGVVPVVNAFAWVLERLMGVMEQVQYKTMAMINTIKDQFNGLVGAVSGPVETVKGWLDNLNPFVRHSPSLIDNIKKGVEVIKDEYGSLKDISTGPTVNATSLAGAGPMSFNISLAGATISSRQDAEARAKEIGDMIIQRLAKVTRY